MSTLTSTARPAPPVQSGPAIRFETVTRRFGTTTAVDAVSLSVPPGEVVALLGPNGAGKTTTIDLVLGLAEPDAGTVSVLGQRPDRAASSGAVSAVLQTGGLLKDLTVAETVRYVAATHGSVLGVGEVLRSAGLEAKADRLVGRCSGGEQQRLRFAVALLPDPALLVLDEPTTGMDVEGRSRFWASMQEAAGQGRTILFATHYLAEADQVADRIVMLRSGRVVADGAPDQIRAAAQGQVVRAFLPGGLDHGTTTALERLDGVREVQVHGQLVTVTTDDSDAAARLLLTTTPARDLRVATRSLDDAFVALAAQEHR